MKSLNGNGRYGLPVDPASGEELPCARLDEGERAWLHPALTGVKQGFIRCGKKAYACAFVMARNGAWIYMSKSTFLRFMCLVSAASKWDESIERYAHRALEVFPPPEEEVERTANLARMVRGLEPLPLQSKAN